MRKLPALRPQRAGRRRPAATPAAVARLRPHGQLAEQDARLEARWGYDLTQHNCITELARTTGGAFRLRGGGERALGAARAARPTSRSAGLCRSCSA